MNISTLKTSLFLTATLTLSSVATQTQAGPIFLSGHDPDFHAQDQLGAKNLLTAGINYVVNNSSNPGARFLWVESEAGTGGGAISVAPGHRRGELGLGSIGLTRGVDYDWVNGASLASVDFSMYSAIAVASEFSGMLMQAELDALNARSGDIASFVNGGGGLLALSEGHDDGHTTTGNWFDYLPVDVSSGVLAGATFQVTPYGASTFGLTDGDVSTYSHSFFAEDYGLNVVSQNSAGQIMTLSGQVGIGNGGFTTVPEPTPLALLAIGLLGLGLTQRRHNRS